MFNFHELQLEKHDCDTLNIIVLGLEPSSNLSSAARGIDKESYMRPMCQGCVYRATVGILCVLHKY